MLGIMPLIHGACAVILLAFAIGIYNQKPDIRGYEALFARQPLFFQVVYVTFLAAIFASCLGIMTGRLTLLAWCFEMVGLIIHEGGHFLTSWAGDFVHALGGTLFEIGVPASLTVWLLVANCKRLGAFTLVWTSAATFSTSIYAGDAETLDLKLLGSSEDINDKMVAHDWHNILSMVGQLEAASWVSDVFWSIAVVAGLSAIALPIWAAFRDRHSQAVFDQKLS